jgi:hypothetical protein
VVPAPAPAVTAQDPSDIYVNLLSESLKNNQQEKVFGEQQTHFIAVAVDEHWVIQGDMLVDEKALIPQSGEGEVRIAQLRGVSYWPEGIVPYTIDAAVDASLITAAMREMERHTAVRFVPWQNEKDYVVVQATTKDCMSNLGRQGGEQKILVNSSCSKGVMLHELMHTLGFVHEHSRADRDDFVTIVWERVEAPYKHQFQKFSAAMSIPGKSTFDFNSILLYHSHAFARNQASPTIVKKDGTTFSSNRTKLSTQDIEKIATVYPPKRE